MGREDIDVYQGSEGPLCQPLHLAPSIHGESGLEGADLKQSEKKPIQ